MDKLTSFILIFLITLIAGSAFAVGNSTSIQLGWLNPEATETGFIIGLTQSRVVDEMVELGVSIDYFSNKHTELFDTSGTEVSFIKLQTNTIMIPLMLNLTIKLPVTSPIKPYLGGSVGYVLLWDKYKNYETDPKIDETKFYGGFGWRVAAGGMYQLGAMSDLTAEVFYNGAKPSRDEGEISGFPAFTEVDMSGVGFRFGVKVYL